MHLLCLNKQILTSVFVTTVALLCQCVIANKQKTTPEQYKHHYYLAPPRSLLRKQIKTTLILCKPLLPFMAELKAF